MSAYANATDMAYDLANAVREEIFHGVGEFYARSNSELRLAVEGAERSIELGHMTEDFTEVFVEVLIELACRGDIRQDVLVLVQPSTVECALTDYIGLAATASDTVRSDYRARIANLVDAYGQWFPNSDIEDMIERVQERAYDRFAH
jgi:hypothetical protein